MVFGIGKKRESWSSRPLSMILPDNVKLFSKKSRGILEKASHEYSGRLVEDHKSVSSSSQSNVGSPRSPRNIPSVYNGHEPITPDTPDEPNHMAKPIMPQSQPTRSDKGYNDSRTGKSEQSPLPEQVNQEVPPPVGSDIVSDPMLHDGLTRNDDTPFLTLDLDDTETSLQDLTDQLSELNVSNTSSELTGATQSSNLNSKRDSMLFLPTPASITSGSPSSNSISSACTSSSTHRTDDKIPEIAWSDSTDTLLISRMTAANEAAKQLDKDEGVADHQTTAKSSEESTSEPFTSVNENEIHGEGAAACLEVPELDRSNRQDSTASADTVGSTGTDDSSNAIEAEERHGLDESSAKNSKVNTYLLNPSVKVMVNHGVYIFDPSDKQDCLRSLNLTEDESFNPFDFD